MTSGWPGPGSARPGDHRLPLVWPSWESESAQQKLARLFETQADYAALVLRAYVAAGAGRGAPPLSELQSAGRAARRVRSDAEASADRLADEPVPAPDDRTARLRPDRNRPPVGRHVAHAPGRRGGLAQTRPAPSPSARSLVLARAEGRSGAASGEAGRPRGGQRGGQRGAHAEGNSGAATGRQGGRRGERYPGTRRRDGRQLGRRRGARPGHREIAAQPAAPG